MAVVDEVAPDADEVDLVEEVDWVEADFGVVDVAVTADEAAAVEVWWEVVVWAARAAIAPTPKADTPATTLVARRLRRSHLSRRRGEFMAPFMPPESGSRLYGTWGPGHSLSHTLGSGSVRPPPGRSQACRLWHCKSHAKESRDSWARDVRRH